MGRTRTLAATAILLVGVVSLFALACQESAEPVSRSTVTDHEAGDLGRQVAPPMRGRELTPEQIAALKAADPADLKRLEMIVHPVIVWGEPGVLDPAAVGNPYSNQALGIEIERPTDWTWLGATSMPDFATRSDTSMRLGIVTEDLGTPIQTPLISMAPIANPQRGIDPEIHLFAKPLTGDWKTQSMFLRIATNTIKSGLITRPILNENYEVLEEAIEVPVSGLPGAMTTVRYDAKGEDGTLHPTIERVWYAQRGPYMFFLHAMAPEATFPELEQQIKEISDSLRIDPGFEQ